jgi:hypothetical protein
MLGVQFTSMAFLNEENVTNIYVTLGYIVEIHRMRSTASIPTADATLP